MKQLLLLFFLISIFTSLSDIAFCQHRIFVNPSIGNDGSSGRDTLHPLRTLSQAGNLCISGDTIFIRGGHYYNEAFTFARYNSDTAGYVWIMPYFNENVILDGAGYNFPSWQAVLNIDHARNVIIQNLNVVNNNNGGAGIRIVSDSLPFFITRNVTVKKCLVNHTNRQGILVQASNVTIDSCEIYDAVFHHAYEQDSEWEFALGTYLWPSNVNCWNNIVFRNNKIHNSWGEGIVALRCYNFTIENNHIYDCYSAYIYVDNSRKGIIRNNWVHSTNDTYNRNYGNGFIAPGVGIQWAAEGNSYKVDSLITDIDIYNNLIVRTNAPISWWRDPNNTYSNNSYRNINVYYNTIFNAYAYESFHLDVNTSGIPIPVNCNFKNNIICLGKYQNIYRQYFTTSSHYQYWQIDYNCFINGNIPVNIQHNISGAPSFVDSTISNLDTNFRIKLSSNCNHSATQVNTINRDYWNSRRDSIHPSIGFHEYGGVTNINTGISDIANIFSLMQNAPNPCNPTTSISYIITQNGIVKLGIYNILGRVIKTLVDNELRKEGKYTVEFNGSNLPSGVYFYKLQVDGDKTFTAVKKMVLIK